jgi:hypothetical protein
VLLNFRLESVLFSVGNYAGANLPASLQNPHDGGLILGPSSSDPTLAFTNAHVARFPADESFVSFALAGEFIDWTHAQSEPDTVIHEPCCFLGHADSPMNFIGTDAILAVHNLPHGGKPLIDPNRRVLHDGAGFRCELTEAVTSSTLPTIVFRLENDTLASTTRAGDAFGPAPRYQILTAVRRMRKVYDGFLKRRRFHASILAGSTLRDDPISNS